MQNAECKMQNLKDYSCPPDCPRRTKDCHSHCERHDKYRAACEERRQANWNDKIMPERAYLRKLR